MFGMCCCVLQLRSAEEKPIQFTERDLLEVTQRALTRMPEGVAPIQDIDQRAQQIIRGGNIAYLIINNQALPFAVDMEHRQEYLNAIVDLIWYFYGQALTKGEAFQEGTFILADHDFAFYNFLMRYVKLVNHVVTDDPAQDHALMRSDNPYGYSRLSSHFVTTQRGHKDALQLGGSYQGLYRHYGIDIRSEQGLDYAALPTNDKSHILFGKIHERPDMMFIKIEKVGIYVAPLGETAQKTLPKPLRELAEVLPGAEQIRHGFDWVKAQVPKIIEQKLSPESVKLIRNWIEFDDNLYNRKERCPRFIIENILSALGPSGMLPELAESFARWTVMLGIKYPYLIMQYCETGDQRYLDTLRAYMKTYSGSPLVEKAQEQLREIVASLQKDSSLYKNLKILVCDLIQQFDHNSLRTGREVLLTRCDLLSSYMYHERVMGKNNPQTDNIINALALSKTMIKMPFSMADVGQEVIKVRQVLLSRVQNPIIGLPETNIKKLLGMCFYELYEEWNIYISALEYVLGESNQTLFSQQSLVDSLKRHMPYRQLMRSLPLIKDETVQRSVAQVIQAKIKELTGKGILTIDVLQDIAQTIPALYVPSMIPEEFMPELRSVRMLSQQELSELKNKVFGRRIILVNNHKPLAGNPRPRLLVQGLKGDGVVWQTILEYGARVDIGSCDTNYPDNATMIRYQPYGESEELKRGFVGSMLGLASKPTDIAMKALLRNSPAGSDQCLVVTIDETGTRLNTEQCNKHQIELWQEAFPTIQYYASRLLGISAYTFEQLKSKYKTDLARYVLALPKENITPSQVTYRVQRLLNEWNPKLYPEQRELVDRIRGYVKWAYRTLFSDVFKVELPVEPDVTSGRTPTIVDVTSLMQRLIEGQIVISHLSDQEIDALVQSIPDIPGSATMSNRDKLTRYIQEHRSK
jgi:hypothetical protein